MNRFRVLRALLVTIAVVVGTSLLGLLVVDLYGAHRLAEVSKRYEREVGSLSLSTFVSPRVAVEQNAVTWQRPGILAVVFFPGDQDVIGSLSAKRFADWKADETTGLEVILERNTPALTLLLRARGMKASNWDIPYEQGTTAKIPNLLSALYAAKLLAARGRLALGRGDGETALVSAEALGTIARSHEAESSLILFLIGLAIEKYQIGLVNELATSPLATPPELDRLEASVCDADLKGALRNALRFGTAAMAHDVKAEELLDSVDSVVPSKLAPALADLVAATVIEANLEADRTAGRPVRAPLVAKARSEDRPWGWWIRMPVVIGGNLDSASARATATASARNLARLAIALRREALATGRYPPTLPSIDGVPTDDPLTGGPRAYEVRADGSADLHSTTTDEIVRSITPSGQLFFDALYRWTLPAPR